MIDLAAPITLTRAEQTLAHFVGQQREKAQQRKPDQVPRFATHRPIHTEGAASEIAFCRLFNVFWDMSIHALGKRVKDHGDATLPSGHTVDVKSNLRDDGDLLVPWCKDPATVDLYALMTGEMPTYQFRGMIWSAEVHQPHYQVDLGKGPCWKVPPGDLMFIYCEAEIMGVNPT